MFMALRQTMRKRLQAKLSEMKIDLQRRMHAPIPEAGQWLRTVVNGHFRYYGVPMNTPTLHMFRFQMGWHCALSRRSQNGRVSWDCMRRLIDRWLPLVRVYHDCAGWALSPKARAGGGKPVCPDLWRGLWATMIPTPTRTAIMYFIAHSVITPRLASPSTAHPCT
jgi:hypothetical protein